MKNLYFFPLLKKVWYLTYYNLYDQIFLGKNMTINEGMYVESVAINEILQARW